MKTYREIITTRNGNRWLVTFGKVSTYKFVVLNSKLIKETR